MFNWCLLANAQSKYATKTGEIVFEASVPSFEEVKAHHRTVGAIFNTETGEFAALALIKGFRFKVALMEEHFNENYMESSKFPKAVVKGRVKDFNISEVSINSGTHTLIGSIEMHGVVQELETEIQLKQEGDNLLLAADLVLFPEDFNIEIPKIVANKIADEVNVKAIFTLSNE